jgi:hypothetical protein
MHMTQLLTDESEFVNTVEDDPLVETEAIIELRDKHNSRDRRSRGQAA